MDDGDRTWLKAELKSIKEIMERILKKSDDQDEEITDLKIRISVVEQKQQSHDDSHTNKKDDKKFSLSTAIEIVLVIIGFLALYFK